ncbi:MAG TPA: hypothetical protein PLL30_03905 [Candidatus Krumholzibacteria bacterium]|nr:hypothetical protein [Candidatus Krumholzibacteria bacterium]HPD70916.1 hypothetical protein [Candidatus Krumholzibacteria bacterium]HRY39384.1 hypothetical protein [Candidatus Krumholzibacteria bacterium]
MRAGPPARGLHGWALALAVSPLLAAAAGATSPGPFAVRYLSAEHVYLDGGRLDGLATGDSLDVEREGRLIARLVAVHVADHSTACRPIDQIESIAAGDLATVVARAARGESAGAAAGAAAPAAVATDAPASPPRTGGATAQPIRGLVALRWSYARAADSRSGWTSEPSLRARLTVPDLVAKGLELRLEGTLRHQDRAHAPGGVAPRSEWRSRVHEAALAYAPDAAGHRWSLGRALPRAVAGAGWVDGVLGEARLGDGTWIGAFGGWQPDWHSSEPSDETRKGGFFVRHQAGRPGARYLAGSLAAVGLYRAGEVSREFLYVAARGELDRRVGVQTGWEIEVNRRWRRDLGGDPISLTGAFVGLRWQAGRAVGINLDYDGRRTPRTAENRSLADSLFNDSLRQGLRLRGRIQAGRHAALTVQGGLRRHPAYGRDTRSWSLAVTHQAAIANVTADAGGYDGPLARGWRAGLAAHRPWGLGNALRVTGGLHAYDAAGWWEVRRSAWFGGGIDLALARKTYAAVDYRYEWGDDPGGHRLFAEIGRRF